MSTEICVANTRAAAEEIAQAWIAANGGAVVGGIGPTGPAELVEANANVPWQDAGPVWIVIVTNDPVHG
jgi:hypothetical protein